MKCKLILLDILIGIVLLAEFLPNFLLIYSASATDINDRFLINNRSIKIDNSENPSVSTNFSEILTQTKDDLSNISIIIVLIFFNIFIILLILWVFRNNYPNILIQPFVDATKDKNFDDMTLSDLLASEIGRIENIYSKKLKGIDAENMGFLRVHPSKDDLTSSISNVGSIGFGQSSISLGNILLFIKQNCFLGDRGYAIRGSLQKHGSRFHLIATLKGNQSTTFAASCDDQEVTPIISLARDMAYIIIKNISSNMRAKNWECLKYFSESISALQNYLNTNNKKYLIDAYDHCCKAIQVEPDYVLLFGLCYNLGLALLNKNDYPRAEIMFKSAISIKSSENPFHPKRFEPFIEYFSMWNEIRNQYSMFIDERYAHAYNGLGASLERQSKSNEAISAYESAIELQPKYPNAHVNLAKLYEFRGRNSKSSDDYELAKKHYRKAIELNEAYPQAKELHDKIELYSLLGLAIICRRLGKDSSSICNKIRQRIDTQNEAAQASFQSVCGSAERAVDLLGIAIDKKQITINDIKNDPDMDFIRDDSLFIEFIISHEKRISCVNAGNDKLEFDKMECSDIT